MSTDPAAMIMAHSIIFGVWLGVFGDLPSLFLHHDLCVLLITQTYSFIGSLSPSYDAPNVICGIHCGLSMTRQQPLINDRADDRGDFPPTDIKQLQAERSGKTHSQVSSCMAGSAAVKLQVKRFPDTADSLSMRRQHLATDHGVDDGDLQPPPKRFRAATSGKVCCQVNGCTSDSSTNQLSFKRFPGTVEKAAPWVQFCGNETLLYIPLKRLHNKEVCSNHIAEKDMGLTGRLKPNAIPTLHAPAPLSAEQMRRWRDFVESDSQSHQNASDFSIGDMSDQEISSCNPSDSSGSASQNSVLVPAILIENSLTWSPHNSTSGANPDVLMPEPQGLDAIPDLFVQGSFNQGDAVRFLNTFGMQCTAISAYAVAMASCLPCDEWDPTVMDTILTKGDECFKQCFPHGGYRYLSPEDVVKSYRIGQKQLDFTIRTAVTPVPENQYLPSHPDNNLPMYLRNELAFENENPPDFVALLVVSYSETIAIWIDQKEQSKYWLFDSHSRDQNGKIVCDGKSFCGRFSSMEDLVQAHYASHRDDAGAIRNGQYQISTVRVELTNKEASETLPNQDERHVFEQDTVSSSARADKPSRKRRRRKQTRQSNRWSRRIRSILDSIEVTVSENPTSAEKELAALCTILRGFAKDILKKYDAAKKQIHHYRTLSIREFLLERGVSEYTIGTAECEAHNEGRNSHGWRHTTSCKAHSVSLQKAGGRRSLNVGRQWTAALPSRATNARVLSGIRIDIGLFQESSLMCHIRILLTSAEDELFKIVVIAFDETRIKAHLTPKRKEGIILGYEDFGGGDRRPNLANECLVFLVQGLVINWNFPAAVMFANAATKGEHLAQLLPRFIRHLKSLGAIPVLTVCDQSAPNRNAIDIFMRDNPVIIDGNKQPSQFTVDGEPLVCIYDPAHLVKTLRNNMLGGKGSHVINGSLQWPITTAEGAEVLHELKWDMFEKLRMLLSSAPLLTRKLTDNHLICNRKMKVKFATELLSATNATLFEHVGDGQLPGATLAAKVVRDLDQLIDLTIGHSSRESADTLKEARKPMSSTSIHTEKFPSYLTKLEKAKLCSYKKVNGETYKVASKSPVTKTWPHTIHGLICLSKMLQIKYNVSEFNVRSTGQCSLESKFSEFKEGRKTPTAQQMLDGIRTTCVREIVKPTSSGTNCEQDWRTHADTLMNFLRPVNTNMVEFETPVVPFQVRYCEGENADTPVLSIPDENSLFAVEGVENPQHQDTLVMHLADSLIRRLRSRGGVTCVSCKSDLFSQMPAEVNSLALQMRSGLLSELPSDKLLGFVKKAWEEFQQSWLSRLHEADIFHKLDLGLAAETDCRWFSCQQHVGNLYSSLTDVLVADRIRVLNTKPVRTNVPEVAPSAILHDLMAQCGILDDMDVPSSNSLQDMIAALGIPEEVEETDIT